MTEGRSIIITTGSRNFILISGTRRASAGRRSADPRYFYRKVLLTSLVVFVTVILFLLAALLAARTSGAAGPVDLTDAELAGVTGQAGISIMAIGSERITASIMKFSDTDSTPHHWLEFRDFAVDDGNGGYFRFDTPLSFSADPLAVTADPITFDVGTNAAGQTLVAYRETSHVSPRWYHVEDFVFCDQSLGSLHLDALSMGPSLQRYGAHADGTSGIDFDYRTRAFAQALRYTYNTLPETLTLTGIHLAGAANGAGDDPANPATWAFTGADNVFRIGSTNTGTSTWATTPGGDIDAGNNPAKIDVGTDTATGVTSLVLSLPMQGSLRVENVTFGGNNFGPIAIDGIRVHRLSIELRGGI